MNQKQSPRYTAPPKNHRILWALKPLITLFVISIIAQVITGVTASHIQANGSLTGITDIQTIYSINIVAGLILIPILSAMTILRAFSLNKSNQR